MKEDLRIRQNIRTTNNLLPVGIILSSWLLFSTVVQAAEELEERDSAFSFEISAGAQYDSNITVTEIDRTTGVDDVAALVSADVSFNQNINSDTELSLGYNFSQSLHDEFTEFDLQSHLVTADLAHDFDTFDAGIAYRIADANLDGDGFLILQQISTYLTRYFSEDYLLRADYTYSDKTFDGRDSRDSTVNAVGADLYYFLNSVRSYFIASYRFEDESAVDPQFGFQGNHFRLRYLRRVMIGSTEARIRLGYSFEYRKYDSLTPSIAEKRDDNRQSLEAEFELPVSESFSVLIAYEYADNTSELLIADYTQNLFSVQLVLSF